MKLNQLDFRFTSAIQYTARNASNVNALQRNSQAGVAPSLASFQYGLVIIDNTVSNAANATKTTVIFTFSFRFLKYLNAIEVSAPPRVNPVSVPPRIAPGMKEIKLSRGIYPALDTILSTQKNTHAPRITQKLFFEKTVSSAATRYDQPINPSMPHHCGAKRRTSCPSPPL